MSAAGSSAEGVTCRICGRPLTDPESVKQRIGPICKKNLKKQQELAKGGNRCKITGDPCDPESYYCHLLMHTSARVQNKDCERLHKAMEASA